jgi:hypothetical protein
MLDSDHSWICDTTSSHQLPAQSSTTSDCEGAAKIPAIMTSEEKKGSSKLIQTFSWPTGPLQTCFGNLQTRIVERGHAIHLATYLEILKDNSCPWQSMPQGNDCLTF